jgi:hypothetical protein
VREKDTYSVWVPYKELTSITGPNLVGVFPPPPDDGNRSSFRNVVFSSFYSTGRWKKSKNPVILTDIHHHQNSLEFICFVGFSQQTNKRTQKWVNRLDRRNFGKKAKSSRNWAGCIQICILEVPASNLGTQTAYSSYEDGNRSSFRKVVFSI